jgi:divalent metal cation (Fe/Co/Zn/Cd) transporter
MLFVVGKVFFENAAGAIGEADEEMEEKLGDLVMNDPDVHDVQEITVIKEGDDYHVEVEVEVDPRLTIAQADDIKVRLEEKLLAQQGVTDVSVEFDEIDNIPHWENQKKESETAKTGN